MNKIVSLIIILACVATLYSQPLIACDKSVQSLKRDADSPPEGERPPKRLALVIMPESHKAMGVEEEVDWKQLYHNAQQQIMEQNQHIENERAKVRSLLKANGVVLRGNVDELLLNNAQLTCFPFCGCEADSPVNLRFLMLHDNKIKYLPVCIGNQKIYILNLDKNEIEFLPESIGDMKNLNSLSLKNNKLTRLPESFSKLATLEDLYLNGNNLESVPECLIKLDSLWSLDLRENPLISATYDDIDLEFDCEGERIKCFLRYDRAQKGLRHKLFNLYMMLSGIIPNGKDVIGIICTIIHNHNLKYIGAYSRDDVEDYLKAKKVISTG